MEEYKVSIILATYRRDVSLEKAIESALSQTYQNLEIIVVDDNADKEWNQKVLSVVNSFNKNNVRLIVNATNLGSAKTRNIGIDAATGEYITFLDDDDIYLSQKVEQQLYAMLANSTDYSLTDLSLYDENDKLIEIRKRDYLETQDNVDLLLCHLKYHMTGTDAMMFKKSYLESIGGFDPIDVGDEFYLMLKAIKAGGKFSYVPCCDIKAYVHTESAGLSSGQSKIDGENRLYKFKKNYFEQLKSVDIRYIKMRHYAVLAFAYKRSKQNLKFLFAGIKSFMCAPISCLKLLKSL